MRLLKWNLLTDKDLGKLTTRADKIGYLRGFQKGQLIDDLHKRKLEEQGQYQTNAQAALWKECQDWTNKMQHDRLDLELRAIALYKEVRL